MVRIARALRKICFEILRGFFAVPSKRAVCAHFSAHRFGIASAMITGMRARRPAHALFEPRT
ncbi:hypothetical protein ABTN34_17145, partial [Acinetobacter baumannii]